MQVIVQFRGQDGTLYDEVPPAAKQVLANRLALQVLQYYYPTLEISNPETVLSQTAH